MKYQLIFIFIFYLIGVDSDGRLTTVENQLRLKNCGNEDSVAAVTMYGITAMATKVSTRHLITSSRVVMNHNIKTKTAFWIHNKEEVKHDNCPKGYIKVPKEAIGSEIVDAYIFCRDGTFWSFPVPMVVEVPKDLDIYSCLPSEGINEKIDTIKSYSYFTSADYLQGYYVQRFLVLNHYLATEDHIFDVEPHLMIIVDSQKAVLLGVYANRQKYESMMYIYFHKLELIGQALCDSTGICADNLTPVNQLPVYVPSSTNTGSQTPISNNFGPLTKSENQERLDQCGKESSYLLHGNQLISLATFISPRHLLTSSSLVMGGTLWRENKKAVDENACERYGYIKVPWFTNAFLTKRDGSTNQELEPLRVTSAVILCDSYSWNLISSCALPMIVEVNQNFGKSYSCLPMSDVTENQLKVVSSNTDHASSKDILKVNSNNTNFIITNYPGFLQLGDVILKNEDRNGKTVTGIAGICSCFDRNASWFYNTKWMAKPICDSTGICAKSPPPSISAPEESSASSSPLPVPPGNPTPHPVPLPPPKPEEPRKDDRLDVDKEYEEFLLRRKGWDEPDDFDNDLFRSKDFKTGSGREKVILVLIVILILI